VLSEESLMNVMTAEHKWKFGLILSTVINGILGQWSKKIDVLTEESLMNVMTAEHKWKFGLTVNFPIFGK